MGFEKIRGPLTGALIGLAAITARQGYEAWQEHRLEEAAGSCEKGAEKPQEIKTVYNADGSVNYYSQKHYFRCPPGRARALANHLFFEYVKKRPELDVWIEDLDKDGPDYTTVRKLGPKENERRLEKAITCAHQTDDALAKAGHAADTDYAEKHSMEGCSDDHRIIFPTKRHPEIPYEGSVAYAAEQELEETLYKKHYYNFRDTRKI